MVHHINIIEVKVIGKYFVAFNGKPHQCRTHGKVYSVKILKNCKNTDNLNHLGKINKIYQTSLIY